MLPEQFLVEAQLVERIERADQSAGQVDIISEAQETYHHIKEIPRLRRLGASVIVLLGLSTGALFFHGSAENNSQTASAQSCETAVCYAEAAGLEVSNPNKTITTEVIPQAASTAAPLAHASRGAQESSDPKPVEPAIDGRIETMLRGVNPTVEGYKEFFTKIDRSFLPYALTKGAFNPAYVNHVAPMWAKEGGYPLIASNKLIWHFMGNTVTPKDQPIDVKAVIDFMDNRSQNGPCCGVNYIIDNGRLIQTSLPDAKLWNNPPYLNRAVEIRAPNKFEVDTEDYEALIYLTTADLVNQKLLNIDPRGIARDADGHQNVRNAWDSQPGNKKFGAKPDFDGPISDRVWNIAVKFWLEHPEVVQLTQPL